MDMDTIQGFFDKLFFEMGHEDSIFILIIMIGSFLIGLLFGWLQGRRGKRKLKKELKQKESELITLQAEHKAMQEQLGLKEADLTKAHLETEELKTKISQIEHEKAQLRAKVENVTNEMNGIAAENLANISRVETLSAEVLSLENKMAEQSELIDTTATNSVVDVDLSEVQNNFDHANLRLAAIEEKLSRMERENSNLKTEIASMKDSSTIAFIEEEAGEEDEELEIENVEINATSYDAEERAQLARRKVKDALGKRITIASADEKDDLKRINGIGPFIEQKLNDLGIFTFKQISEFDETFVEEITDAIQFFPGRINRDDWVGQAKNLFKNY